MSARFAVVFLVCVVACDGGSSPAAAPTPAQAPEAEAREGIARRKAEREAKAAAQEAEKRALEAKIDGLAQLPDKVPKKQGVACKLMLAAYDGYMRKVLDGDMLTKWETGGNEMQLKVFDRECRKSPPDVAACQAHALGTMSPALHKELATVMTRCKQKFGKAG